MRVLWRTDHERLADAGTFRLTIHSAISGRPLLLAVDRQGAGHDISYVHESPRIFYGVVESKDLDWSFTVEEAVPFGGPPPEIPPRVSSEGLRTTADFLAPKGGIADVDRVLDESLLDELEREGVYNASK